MLAVLMNLGFAAGGTPDVTVPNVVGEAQAAGTADLQAVGFVVAVATAYSSVVPAGTIISQDPVGGSTAAPGATVTITVSLGDVPVTTGVGSTGGGGGIAYRTTNRHKRARQLNSLLDESLPAVYAELNAAPKQVATQAKAIVAPFKAADTVDWAALEANASAVGRLLALVAKQRTAERVAAEKLALQRSDEDWFLMN